MSRVLVPGLFLALFFVAACLSDGSRRPDPTPPTSPESVSPESMAANDLPHPFPVWNAGKDCENEPPIQVFEYDEGFYILRLSKCTHFEAPFVYLIFGDDRVLLWDTGVVAESVLAETVDRLIEEWCVAKGVETLPLVVGHSHGHFDHVAGDGMFWPRPNTKVVRATVQDVCRHYGIENWPEERVEYDLGGRVLDLIPTPGHHPAHLALYDRRTELLVSGDTFYPGFLFIFRPDQWNVFRASTARLLAFAEEHPVQWILGCHVELSRTGEQYPYGTQLHPDERPLHLTVDHLRQLHRSLNELGDEPAVKEHRDFVVYPVWIADRDR